MSPIQYRNKSEIWSQCLSLPHPPFPKQILGGKNNVPEFNVDQSPCSEKGIPPKNTWGKDPVAETWFYIQERAMTTNACKLTHRKILSWEHEKKYGVVGNTQAWPNHRPKCSFHLIFSGKNQGWYIFCRSHYSTVEQLSSIFPLYFLAISWTTKDTSNMETC